MPLFIKAMKLTKDPTIIGFAQLQAVKLVHKMQKQSGLREAKKGTITPRGKLRPHTFSDAEDAGLLRKKALPEKGGYAYFVTPKGLKAMTEAKVAKAPPSGYRKVRKAARPVLQAA